MPGPLLEFRQKQTLHQAQTLESALEEFAALPPSHQAPRHVPTSAGSGVGAGVSAGVGAGVGDTAAAEGKPTMLVLFTGGVSWTEVRITHFTCSAYYILHVGWRE